LISPQDANKKQTLDGRHEWQLLPEQASKIQECLREQVHKEPLPTDEIHLVAGVDASYGPGVTFAAAVLLAFPSLEIIDRAVAEMSLDFPYIPGLLSFREAPAILAALEKLSISPDMLIADGHGLAHPRRFGLACHLGIWLDLPSIGCAKSILVGEMAPLRGEAGGTAPLTSDDELVGVALRTRTDVKPVYISIGHRMDLESAVRITLTCSKGYRLPEPIRQAHILAKEARKSKIDEEL
jgi:deoxyribonuclease V